jgi:hypothetical protein
VTFGVIDAIEAARLNCFTAVGTGSGHEGEKVLEGKVAGMPFSVVGIDVAIETRTQVGLNRT